jgi:DNA-binding CsgD family transcriptional regulator
MDLTTARRAVALSREGKGTREIAQALGISFDRYDPKSVKAALARTRRLLARGG